MTTDLDPTYIADNRRFAERMLILLQSRRLLRDRFSDEDQEYCRRSADDLRKALQAEMLAIEDGGYLLTVLTDLQRCCTTFVSAAGSKAKNFRHDHELFAFHLGMLREVFAQWVRHVVDGFALSVTPEIQEIMDFKQ
ncbi:hypothetical protein ACIBG5_37210 [Kribbella sp. NPDC050241]|uniref:hypothetical protein n=1 Tax=Kribbella sp. NPDC050241 TaxID=3364115 RepID=UPI0037B8A292